MHYYFDVGTLSLKGNYLTWDIYNFFSFNLRVGCEIRSKQFIFGDNRYTLFVWPRGHKGGDTEDWFGMCLYKYDAPGIGDSVQFSIASSVGNIKTCTVQCSENNLFRQERFMEWSDFLILSNKIVQNGCLTIICRLFVENGQRSYSKTNYSRACLYPMFDSSFKHQTGISHSHDPFPSSPSVRICSPEVSFSLFPSPNFSYGSSSNTSSFYSSSMFENSIEYVPESVETRNSNFKIPCNTAIVRKGNALRSSYLRMLGIASEKKPPIASVNPVSNETLKANSKTECYVATTLSNIRQSPQGLNNTSCSTLGIACEKKIPVTSMNPVSNVLLKTNSKTTCCTTTNLNIRNSPQCLNNTSCSTPGIAYEKKVHVVPVNPVSNELLKTHSKTTCCTATTPSNIRNSSQCLNNASCSTLGTVSKIKSPSASVNPFSNVLLKTNSKKACCTEATSSRLITSPAWKNDVNWSTNGPAHAENFNQPSVSATVSDDSHESLRTLSQHLKNLYLEGKEFDMTINMAGREFRVLRAILVARCPKFAELLSQDASSNNSNTITIDAFDACDITSFHHFLLYIYSGEIEHLYEKHLYGLYCAACKFGMRDLKEKCINLLQTSLTIGTVIDVFRETETNDSDWWKMDVAVNVLARDIEVILNTEEWKQFINEDRDRASEYQRKALKIHFEKMVI